MGFSETCTDADSDGICDSSYTLASGNVDYLPLRITTGGATTTTTTTSSTTTTTARWSGNGGGGGGGGAPTSFEAWINNVSANQTFDLEIDDEDIPYINGLSLTAKQAIYSSKLAITDLDKKPWSGMADPDATVYRYFKVSYDKDNSVKSAKLKVSVKKSWLKANDVDPYTISLYRYATTWTKLDTKILKEDGEDIYFEVTTPGFSYFSLGGANGSGYRPIAEETPAATTTTTTLKPTTTTTPAVTPAPQVTYPAASYKTT